MGTIGSILVVVGTIIAIIYGIFILVNAFKKSILWGLGSLFIPFVGLIYVILHWDINKQPFFRYVIGLVIIIIGTILGGAGAVDNLPEP